MEPITTLQDTANDRFKRSFGDWYWYSIAGAAMLHVVLFAFFPGMSSADMSTRSDELIFVDIPDEIVIPPAPEVIARPAVPVISSTAPEDVSISPTTFEEMDRIAHLAPPPTTSGAAGELSRVPQFTPRTVEPELRNRAEVERALSRNYPPLLRDAGIGGSPRLWFFIDEDGRVANTLLKASSGYPDLDEAARKVAEVMRFSPALNLGRPVPVWVEIPILFSAR
ncbi:MAG: TonB family protein [Gemmatimonadota bacterium]